MDETESNVLPALSVQVKSLADLHDEFSLMRPQQTITWLIPVPPPPSFRDHVIAEVEQAHKFFFDPRNTQLGSYEERDSKYRQEALAILSRGYKSRCADYLNARCRHRNIDWNQGGNSSWQQIDCLEHMRFIRETLVHTQNGDWKEGPVWYNDDRGMKWKTGGHHHNETFAECEAHYDETLSTLVIDEIRDIRADLAARGSPTPPFPPQK